MEGLTITVFLPTPENIAAGNPVEQKLKGRGKGKSKAKGEGRELIVDAHLRLKAGVHYGLLGKNGTGKSSTAMRNLI